jgi:phospholipase C
MRFLASLRARSSRLLANVVASITVVSLSVVWCPAASAAQPSQPVPNTPVQHFIAVMQENHTFDNYFGTYPGAEGPPENTCIWINPSKPGLGCQAPYLIGDEGISDLPHDVKTFKRQYMGGEMKGFIRAVDRTGGNGRQTMGYYDDSALPFYWNLAERYVLFDHFFSSSHGGSLENHLYWVTGTGGSGQAPKPGVGYKNGPTTIFDKLEQAGVTWKFYVQNYNPNISYLRPTPRQNPNRGSQVVWNPLLNYPRFVDDPEVPDATELSEHIVDASEYFDDLQKNKLPQVAYIVPSGSSEHPPGSVEAGQQWIRSLVNALMLSDSWSSSAFLLMYDDWGGWYDHVDPPQKDRYGYGFRVPAILVSPFAKQGFIDTTEYDFTSVLTFIEHNFGLDPLSSRDATANFFRSGETGPFDFDNLQRKPEIVPLARVEPVEPPGPPRSVFFGFYGFGILVGVAIVLVAFVVMLRRRSVAVVRRLPEKDSS